MSCGVTNGWPPLSTPGLEILVASIEATQSLDSGVLAAELSSRTYPTFYANLSFDANHQALLELLVRQVSGGGGELGSAVSD
jgi:hypothetical protein